MVLQTNMSDILARIDDQNRLVKQEAGLSAAPAAVVHQLKSMNLPQQFKDMKLPDLPQAIKVILLFCFGVTTILWFSFSGSYKFEEKCAVLYFYEMFSRHCIFWHIVFRYFIALRWVILTLALTNFSGRTHYVFEQQSNVFGVADSKFVIRIALKFWT